MHTTENKLEPETTILKNIHFIYHALVKTGLAVIPAHYKDLNAGHYRENAINNIMH